MGIFNRNKTTQEAQIQSAPRPSAQEEARRLYAEQQQKAMNNTNMGTALASEEKKKIIDRQAVLKAAQTLKDYKSGKANLERRVIENAQWYKLRHWECMRGEKKDIEPVSGWLFNAIENKHADCMDNVPRPNFLPREEGDKGEAQMLSSIVPVLLDHTDFEGTYSDLMRDKLEKGTGVYGVFWDNSLDHGMGNINIARIDILNLFWEPGILDIQKSRNIFHVELKDNDLLASAYPQLLGKLGGNSLTVSKYIYDDTVDTLDKTPVVDWYYKKMVGGRTVLHFVKFVGDEVLYSSEDDPNYAERGWYDHGVYPFVFDVMYPTEGTPAGFGLVDVCKSAQSYIDRGDQAILENMMFNAKPRYFYREDGSINAEDFADTNKTLIPYQGTQGPDTLFPVQVNTLSPTYLEVASRKIEELKEVSGNRDSSTGGTTGGVTSAAGLAAQIEAGSKLSRDMSKTSYRAFKEVCTMIVELIRQFYDLPRKFRILGQNGAEQYVAYSNSGIVPQSQGMDIRGQDMGYRLPVFDIEISAERKSPYSRMAQNDLALAFYNAGFFAPNNADMSLACLDMMDFDRKEFVMQKVAQNGTMYQMILQMQQQMLMLARMVDKAHGNTAITESLMAQFGGQMPMPSGAGGTPNPEKSEALGGESGVGESSVTKKSKQRVAESTNPT